MVSDDGTLAAKEEYSMEEAEEDSASASASASAPRKLLMLNPGTISRRIRANPLKHVAHLLRQKLVAAHGAPCNMLQVAFELHSQAQDKKNTTLRRIYDVVNVCEGAGVLARTGPKPPELKEKTASDQTLLQRYFPFRRTGKRNLRGGCAIHFVPSSGHSAILCRRHMSSVVTDLFEGFGRWVGGSSDDIVGENSESPCKNQKHVLEMEKGQTVDRILQKRRLCDTLSKQVSILQKLVEENQENSKTSGDLGDIFSGLSSLHSLEGYCDVDYLLCDPFVDQQRPFTPKRLHLPFVMLATNPDANVDICMTGDPPYQVHLQLDQSYCLIDHIQMIKMLPEGRTDKHPQLQTRAFEA